MDKRIVLKIGGSILYKEDFEINTVLMSKLVDWYKSAIKEYSSIVIVVGGGKLSRFLQSKVEDGVEKEDSLHQIGMSVTQLNASIIYGYLGDNEVYIPRGLGDAYEYLKSEGQLKMVTGGLKIGWSTDLDAAIFADTLGIKKTFKISNIDYLYDSDPKENPNARPLKDILWKEYFRMFNITRDSEHIPNFHIPVDRQCALFMNSKDMSMHITGGKRIEEVSKLEELLQGGSYIHS